ncbi:MAG TPA: MFS transporter [Luteimonas sp.]|nr:MFS transporter [Luteimonas sp.]
MGKLDGAVATDRIRSGEWRAVAFSFAYFFCVLAAYYVMRPVREQLSAAVGSTQLPWFFAATFVATLLLTPVFAWLVSRWPRRVVVPAVYLFFIACLLAFVPLFTGQGLLGPRALGIVFFVWVSVFNLFVVSVFWSFMADIWDDAQARRLFPVIGLGGTAGAIAGPVLTRQLVEVIGVAPLLVVSALLLGGALACVLVLGRWAREHGSRRNDARNEAAVGGGMFDGLKQVFATPFIRNMALLMLLGDAIGTVAYALITDYSGATFHDAVSRTRFAASVDLVTNTVQVVTQLTLTRWLLVRHGAGAVFLTRAAVGIVACAAMALAADPYAPVLFGLPWVALMLVMTRSLAYGMDQPARESLFTLVPRDWRYKGKNAVDTAVWRAGDVVVAGALNGLRALGASTSVFGWIGAAALALGGTIGWRLARGVERPAPARPAAADA